MKSYVNRIPLRMKLLRLMWNIVYWTMFRFSPRGKRFNWWRNLLLRCFGAKMGTRCTVLPSARIWAPWNLDLGSYCCVSAGVNLYSVARITLETHAIVSQYSFICTASHDISSVRMELTYKPIRLCKDSWTAAKAIVLPGVTVGEGAVVGCGSVVTKDVAPWTVVAGNPARVVGKREIKEDAK